MKEVDLLDLPCGDAVGGGQGSVGSDQDGATGVVVARSDHQGELVRELSSYGGHAVHDASLLHVLQESHGWGRRGLSCNV